LDQGMYQTGGHSTRFKGGQPVKRLEGPWRVNEPAAEHPSVTQKPRCPARISWSGTTGPPLDPPR